MNRQEAKIILQKIAYYQAYTNKQQDMERFCEDLRSELEAMTGLSEWQIMSVDAGSYYEPNTINIRQELFSYIRRWIGPDTQFDEASPKWSRIRAMFTTIAVMDGISPSESEFVVLTNRVAQAAYIPEEEFDRFLSFLCKDLSTVSPEGDIVFPGIY